MTEKIIHTIGAKGGGLAAYRSMVTGTSGFFFWLRYELCMLLFRNLSGILGYGFRRVFYPGLFGACGRGVVIGTGVTLRNPRNITLGDHVILDDNCVLDAKGDACKGVHIGSNVFISRNAVLSCKDGGITVGSNSSIGPNTIVHSTGERCVNIGHHNVIASTCYLIGAGDYSHERLDVPMADQKITPTRGIDLEDDIWLAASVIVTDGSRIGTGSIIGCGSLVRGDIPPRSIAYGVPAKVVRSRKRPE